MSTLVGYGSSDEEDDIQPEKPGKILETTSNGQSTLNHTADAQTPESEPAIAHLAALAPDEDMPMPTVDLPAPDEGSMGPALEPQPPASRSPSPLPSAPSSPYTAHRQRLRELTMPPAPDFNIPDAPPLPPENSEEATRLAAVTKKFERFLELKKQGVHFNSKLQSSSSLRNPSLGAKLMDFAGISAEDSYASTLPEEVAVPTKWAEECYVDALVKQNEFSEKKRLLERERVEFVGASGGNSANGMPSGRAGKGSAAERVIGGLSSSGRRTPGTESVLAKKRSRADMR